MINRDNKRLQKQAERDRRVEKLHQTYPELASLERRLRLTGIRLVQGAIGRLTPEELAALNQERQELTAARRDLLQRLRIDASLFEVHWDCPRCEDRGWTDFGVKCPCLIQEEIDEAFAQSGLTGDMKSQTFATFSMAWYERQEHLHPGLASRMRIAVERCRDFSDAIIAGSGKGNLLFYGTVGTGKSHLSSAIANRLLGAGKTVIYRTISQIMSSIMEAKFDFQNSGRQPEVLTALRSVDLVIIDDLGTEKPTDFVVTELFELVNDRLRMGKPMVVSTNIELGELASFYNHRLADRLIMQSYCILFEGKSIRQLMKVAGHSANG
ncbi:ATP-binding protein [Heliobacterium gestii]|uniref:ATP-binding protein n=1 Tax=Heliomicrobium gestii TaxID=2699 RepID=A0A845LIE2_HELGE|nr:ATP-binding protein [Heliomicrobium gestii]MBM7867792.1 DNA replication protein DnaC [Heliomicrobium gestii]MZP44185.1 ATP-binding protein [Heliomicrobium gestii]